MLKKTIVISLIFISSFFCGCKNSLFNEDRNLEEIKIGVSIYEKSDEFMSSIVDNLYKIVREKELESKYKFILTVNYSDNSQYNQNEHVDRFINQDYDVMCINLVDRRSASFIIDKAKKADIPIVFFNREPVEEDMNLWDKIHYVGAKSEESGVMQGDIILDIYNRNKKQIGVLLSVRVIDRGFLRPVKIAAIIAGRRVRGPAGRIIGRHRILLCSHAGKGIGAYSRFGFCQEPDRIKGFAAGKCLIADGSHPVRNDQVALQGVQTLECRFTDNLQAVREADAGKLGFNKVVA